MTNLKIFKKYFQSHSEKEVKLCQNLPTIFSDFDLCLSVPLYDELDHFEHLVESVSKASRHASKRILLILCVNNRESSSQKEKNSNKALLSFWKKRLSHLFEKENIFGGFHKDNGFLFLDRSSEGQEFSEKEGVGLARKITCDMASFLFLHKRVKTSHITTTDGDAILPEDFFIFPELNASKYVMLSHFSHKTEGLTELEKKAVVEYENYLQSYVDGLTHAGSPYAFHTIGSCISFSAETYVIVRGFPKSRLAGEDFYFLNKAKKVATFLDHKASPILLSPRLSERVPFGTGRALSKIHSSEKRYFPYPQKSFLILKQYLSYVELALTEEQEALEFLKKNENLKVFLEKSSYQKLALSFFSREKKSLKDFHDFFDGFNTLKFIKKTQSYQSLS